MILLSRPATGQIQLGERKAKLILRDLAELDRRRQDAALDSMEIHALKLAYNYKDSALISCRSAIVIAARIERDKDGIIAIQDKKLDQARKELRKQKFLKWVGFGLAAIAITLAATK